MATKWDDRSKKLGDRGQEQKKFPSFYLWGFDGVPSLYCYHGTFQSVCSQTKLIMASLSHFVYKNSAYPQQLFILSWQEGLCFGRLL